MNQTQWMRCALAAVWVVGMMAAPSASFAEQKFEPKVEISDGKDGRPWAQWKQAIKEKPVKHVVVVLQKVSGGDDTFVNLRFGEKGQTLEGGRRVLLTNTEKQKVTFQVDGQSPGGQPLVLNAYKGVVKVKRVTVHYKD